MKSLTFNNQITVSKTFAFLHFLSQLIILCALVIFCSEAIHAKNLSTKSSKLKKNISFHGHTVSGKYQMPLESTTTVEDDKSLDDLIGVRKNFQDRIQISKELR